MRLLPRRTGATTLATLGTFAGAFVLVHLLAPQWARAAGLNVWEVDHYMEQCQQEGQRGRELADIEDQLNRQFGAADAVAAALLDDRITFSAAVDAIDEILRARPGFEEVLACVHPKEYSHRESSARYLIEKVRAKIDNNPARQAATIQRLEAEFKKLTAPRG